MPRSAKEVVSDEQHTVYAVTVFKTHEDEIKRALREERYHIREWQVRCLAGCGVGWLLCWLAAVLVHTTHTEMWWAYRAW